MTPATHETPDVKRPSASGLMHAGSVLRTIAAIIVGVTIGMGMTLMWVSASGEAFERLSIVGVVTGVAAFIFFFLLRVVLARLAARGFSGTDVVSATIHGVLASTRALFGSEQPLDESKKAAMASFSKSLGEIASQATGFITSYIAATAAIGLAVTLVGGVVSMAAVIAANRQVERMRDQNALIEQQIFEATATRISQVFSAQLASLLDEISESRKQAFDRNVSWTVDRGLQSRIQALIYATQPYAIDKQASAMVKAVHDHPGIEAVPSPLQIDHDQLRFSPERGQLLSILIGLEFPFSSLQTPLDFSYADLRGMSVGTATVVQPVHFLDLGETVLRYVNFRETRVSGLNLSKTDMAGSFLPLQSQMKDVLTWQLHGQSSVDVRFENWIGGANLSGATLDYSRISDMPASVMDAHNIEKELSISSRDWFINHAWWNSVSVDTGVVLVERTDFPVLLNLIRKAAVHRDAGQIGSGVCRVIGGADMDRLRGYLKERPPTEEERFFVSEVFNSVSAEGGACVLSPN